MFVMCQLLLANLSFCHVSFAIFVAMEDETSGEKQRRLCMFVMCRSLLAYLSCCHVSLVIFVAMEVEASGEKAEEVVHVCHVSFVACQFVILSCVICQFCSNGG